jgi:hypothetical protein
MFRGRHSRMREPARALRRPRDSFMDGQQGQSLMNHLHSLRALFVHVGTPDTPMHAGSRLLVELSDATKATTGKTCLHD